VPAPACPRVWLWVCLHGLVVLSCQFRCWPWPMAKGLLPLCVAGRHAATLRPQYRYRWVAQTSTDQPGVHPSLLQALLGLA
jgi:hypothetical protein